MLPRGLRTTLLLVLIAPSFAFAAALQPAAANAGATASNSGLSIDVTGSGLFTDRMVQMGRRALNPPGDARPDLWIIQQLAVRMGLPWNYEGEESGVAAVYEEMRQASA